MYTAGFAASGNRIEKGSEGAKEYGSKEDGTVAIGTEEEGPKTGGTVTSGTLRGGQGIDAAGCEV